MEKSDRQHDTLQDFRHYPVDKFIIEHVEFGEITCIVDTTHSKIVTLIIIHESNTWQGSWKTNDTNRRKFLCDLSPVEIIAEIAPDITAVKIDLPSIVQKVHDRCDALSRQDPSNTDIAVFRRIGSTLIDGINGLNVDVLKILYGDNYLAECAVDNPEYYMLEQLITSIQSCVGQLDTIELSEIERQRQITVIEQRNLLDELRESNFLDGSKLE